MHQRIVIERPETRIRILEPVVVDLVVAAQAADHIGQCRAADTDNDARVGVAQDVPGEENAAHRDQRIGDAADRINHAVVMHARVSALEHRMDEQDRAEVVGCLPKRVERGIIKNSTDAFRLRADHGAGRNPAACAARSTSAARAPSCSGTVASGIRRGSRSVSALRCSLARRDQRSPSAAGNS